jgi:AcrR family transcriptional regulator
MIVNVSRTANPVMRVTLIDAAAKLLAEEGPRNLTLRRLAAEVGASTMAVYTYFGGMDELRRAVREEGFARLAADLGSAERTDDPVADLGVLGTAYYLNAVTNRNLYVVMFGEHVGELDPSVGLGTFETLVDAVARCVEDGRFHPADPNNLATQIWVMSHGVVTLQLAGFLAPLQALECFAELGQNLFVAFGDEARASQKSLESVRRRVASESRLRALLG